MKLEILVISCGCLENDDLENDDLEKAGNKRTIGGNYERVRGGRRRKITEK